MAAEAKVWHPRHREGLTLTDPRVPVHVRRWAAASVAATLAGELERLCRMAAA